MLNDTHCPNCGVTGGEEAAVCETCQMGVIEATPEPLKELLRQFDQPPMPVIGEGRKRATEVVEYVDAEEARFNLKYGLDKEGNPLPSHKLMERSEEVYGATLSEGFSMLADSDDSYDDDRVMAEGFFSPNGFNQNW